MGDKWYKKFLGDAQDTRRSEVVSNDDFAEKSKKLEELSRNNKSFDDKTREDIDNILAAINAKIGRSMGSGNPKRYQHSPPRELLMVADTVIETAEMQREERKTPGSVSLVQEDTTGQLSPSPEGGHLSEATDDDTIKDNE